MRDEHDYELTRALGVRAMNYIKELKSPPSPECYALLYHHAAGYDRTLSTAIQDLIRDRSGIGPADASRLHDEYLSPGKRISPLSRTLSARSIELARALDEAESQAVEYQASLQAAGEELAACGAPDQAGSVLRRLLAASGEIARRNRDLEHRLTGSMQEVDSLTRSVAALRAESETDPLTGLADRRRFERAVAEALARVREDAGALCLLIVDIDEFRAYNEAHGYQVGDRILRHVADLVREAAGSRCEVARYAGDQFAVLLPQTMLETAVRFAEQLRTAAQGKKFVRKSSGRSVGGITLSVGVVLYGYGDTVETLIERAQDCLRTAKRLGRNRVRSAANARSAPGTPDG